MKKKYVIVGTMMLLIGMVGVNAANTVASNGVLYSNSNSSVTTVEGALNELYTNYNNLLTKGDAAAANILTGKKVLVKGKEVTGTMANNGSVSKALAAGGSYTIPKGYHDGTGKVTANSLASQTSATATAAQILKDKTAYVNGSKITGTMANRGAVSSKITAGGSYTIPAGYHNGSGKVSVTHTIKSWCPNYGNWINTTSMYTTDTYTVNATSLYVLVRAENGGSVYQQAAPSCSDGTIQLLVNNGSGLLYYVSKTSSATFTLTIGISRNYSSEPNSTLKVFAFTNN